MTVPENTLTIISETPDHGAAIDALLDYAFGPGRFTKTAERLREGNHAIADLCMLAFDGDEVCASVRFWPIHIGGQDALLLGPLVVDPRRRGQGIGIHLMQTALDKAKSLGHDKVLLVGDEPYYQKVGFHCVPTGSLQMPGPVDPERLLICDLDDDGDPVSGAVTVPPGTNP